MASLALVVNKLIGGICYKFYNALIKSQLKEKNKSNVLPKVRPQKA